MGTLLRKVEFCHSYFCVGQMIENGAEFCVPFLIFEPYIANMHSVHLNSVSLARLPIMEVTSYFSERQTNIFRSEEKVLCHSHRFQTKLFCHFLMSDLPSFNPL